MRLNRPVPSSGKTRTISFLRGRWPRFPLFDLPLRSSQFSFFGI
jgi:hypothetical protein